MSQAKQKSDDSEVEITKKLTFALYPDNPDELTRRQWADKVDDSRDYFETREYDRTDEEWGIEIPGGDVIEIDQEMYEKLGRFDTGALNPFHDVDERTEIKKRFRPERAARDIVGSAFDSVMPDEDDLPFGWHYGLSNSVRDGEDNTVFRRRTRFDREPMLKHQSEATAEDIYVDEDEDYLVIKLSITVMGVNEEQLDWLNENVISSAFEVLWRDDRIDKVRIFDCEQKMREEGVCFNV